MLQDDVLRETVLADGSWEDSCFVYKVDSSRGDVEFSKERGIRRSIVKKNRMMFF